MTPAPIASNAPADGSPVAGSPPALSPPTGSPPTVSPADGSSSAANPPPRVFGLILAGGSSSRMQSDKAALLYQGHAQLDRAFALVERHVGTVFVSVRPPQASETTRATRPMVIDSVAGEGPIVGIRSALAMRPEAAWLVVACDLPFLSDAALEQLLLQRDPTALATAFRSSHDGLPEPLCAIWEPAAGDALAAYQREGGRCPRKFLMRHAVPLLEPHDPRALDNVNTPEEYRQALNRLAGAETSPMHLTVQYYALMREQAGRSEEALDTRAETPADLLSELTARYGFTLSRDQLKVAVNSEFADWSRKLLPGDAVVFIPPVAGG